MCAGDLAFNIPIDQAVPFQPFYLAVIVQAFQFFLYIRGKSFFPGKGHFHPLYIIPGIGQGQSSSQRLSFHSNTAGMVLM